MLGAWCSWDTASTVTVHNFLVHWCNYFLDFARDSVYITPMKACINTDDVLGCGATGFIFGGIKPMRWALCIRCKGTGFVTGKPIGPAEIKIHNLGSRSTSGLVFSMSDFSEVKTPLMAHVMAKAGIFPSVSQARKNGWDKPLIIGEWTVTKKKIKIEVVS